MRLRARQVSYVDLMMAYCRCDFGALSSDPLQMNIEILQELK